MNVRNCLGQILPFEPEEGLPFVSLRESVEVHDKKVKSLLFRPLQIACLAVKLMELRWCLI
jgi:hypothetical protein